MRKLLYLCILCVFGTAYAIEVDQKELKEAENAPIEFTNYTGEHTKIDSLQAIEAIGYSLARAIKSGRAGDRSRYSVIHAVDASVKEGFDADILVIGKKAQVDHINNMRVIIASYLKKAYGYTAKDAKTIAYFVTIYNAVYRSNMDAFNSRYKPVVTKYLRKEQVGLGLHYDEWAGKSQIVIPLSDIKYQGTLSSIDTTSISDKKVVEKMREQDDMDIATRKDMIDLKERESTEAYNRAEIAEQDAVEALQQAAEKRRAADEATQEAEISRQAAEKNVQDADTAKKEAEAAKKEAEAAQRRQNKTEQDKKDAAEKAKIAVQKNKDAIKAEKEAEAAKKEAETKEKDAALKQQESTLAQEDATEKVKIAKEEEQFAQKKDEEVESDRKDVASDTRKILEENQAEKKAQQDALLRSAFPDAVLRVIDSKTMLSEVVMVDLKTEKTLSTSSLNTIRGRCLIASENSLIVIAGKNEGNEMITLAALDSHTLAVIKQGHVQVAEESLLVQSEDSVYAVVKQKGKYYLGRFNADLELKAQSVIEVLPYTAIKVSDEGILIQNAGNKIKVLNTVDLSEEIK